EPGTHAALASFSSSSVPTEIQDLAGIGTIHKSQSGIGSWNPRFSENERWATRPAHGCSGSSAQDLLSGLAPQLALPLHSFIQAKVLQFVFHPRPHDHQLVTMQQQLPQVAHFTRRHPDPRKPPLDQQL